MTLSAAENYLSLKESIAEIAEKCGRKGKDITLVAVSKQHNVEEIKAVYDAGCPDFGENKIQEVLPKIDQLPKDIHWHLIGHLQNNKVKKAIGQFSLIHSVDSQDLAFALSNASVAKAVKTSILLQVNISKELSKQGMAEDECLRQFEEIYQMPGLVVSGLMTMAPLTDNEMAIRQCFAKCRELREELLNRYQGASLPYLSMGMSNDYQYAIEEGATHLRVGSLIFGEYIKELSK